MRYLTFDKGGMPTVGVRQGDEIVDLSVAGPDLPRSLIAIIEGGADALAAVANAVDKAAPEARISFTGTRLLPPIARPSKIACVGLNYAGHRAEAGEEGNERPAFPGMFHKLPASLVGHGQPILRPLLSEALDFEGELAVIVGSRAHRVTRESALDHVFGYTILDDGSVRDFQVHKALAAGKNVDATGAVGPEVVTKDELPAGASGLKLETRINGEVMQSSNTELLIFDVADIIVLLSEIHVLEPGDIIATGTCAGVGGSRTPPVWLKAGDTLEIEIEGIGILRNPVVDEVA